FKIGVANNKYVLGAICICLALYFAVLLPGVREIFSIPNYFSVMKFGICLLLALASTVVMELVKVFKS
ncbi:MAG: cation transporting ATPase C-terminal domain-containing protein, partial [Clostridium sp.]|nr:cation transporting ATPase C-terminal domain-containing protein [Clostridium sp.]